MMTVGEANAEVRASNTAAALSDVENEVTVTLTNTNDTFTGVVAELTNDWFVIDCGELDVLVRWFEPHHAIRKY